MSERLNQHILNYKNLSIQYIDGKSGIRTSDVIDHHADFIDTYKYLHMS